MLGWAAAFLSEEGVTDGSGTGYALDRGSSGIAGFTVAFFGNVDRGAGLTAGLDLFSSSSGGASVIWRFPCSSVHL